MMTYVLCNCCEIAAWIIRSDHSHMKDYWSAIMAKVCFRPSPLFWILITSDSFYVVGQCLACCIPEIEVKVRHMYLSCVAYISPPPKKNLRHPRVCAHGMLLFRF